MVRGKLYTVVHCRTLKSDLASTCFETKQDVQAKMSVIDSRARALLCHSMLPGQNAKALFKRTMFSQLMGLLPLASRRTKCDQHLSDFGKDASKSGIRTNKKSSASVGNPTDRQNWNVISGQPEETEGVSVLRLKTVITRWNFDTGNFSPSSREQEPCCANIVQFR